MGVEDPEMGKSWEHNEALGRAQLEWEFWKGLVGMLPVGLTSRNRTGEGRGLAWCSTGAAVPLVSVHPFFPSTASPPQLVDP